MHCHAEWCNAGRQPQIKNLIQSVIPQSEEQEKQVNIFLQKWIVGCVARVFFHWQNPVLIFFGEQNIGKSTFFKKLCAGIEHYFLESEVNIYDKDHQLFLAKKFIWLIDEFGSELRTKDRNKMKAFITKDDIDVRASYGRYSKVRQRICSFAGTTNDLDILTDPTGNRRYLILPVLKFDFDLFNSINMTHLWGEIGRAHV